MPEDVQKARSLLIFVVAYNAEKILHETLSRIPESIKKYNYRILVIDDSSRDNTFAKGLEFKQSHPDLKLEVLWNPVNQGYGGNQKLGYQYAIDNGFDAVALLHGDGQYAPEMLEELSLPILKGEAEAVFGTRMAKVKNAFKGGMPVYKIVGNRILTTFQNRLLKSNLTEFHSGYRVYSVKALSEIPFQYNTNDFHFDTEIIIQLMLKRYRIHEIEIPTYYGDEICHVNGLKYAWDVVMTTVKSRMHQMGIFYHRIFDVAGPQDPYDLKLGYASSHSFAIETVKEGSRVLDLGCGQGLLAGELKKKGCYVHGVDCHDLENPLLVDTYTKADLNSTELDFSISDFDTILLMDIIEHLSEPERFMDMLREKIENKKEASIIISVPNVAFFLVRIRLLFGAFQYGKSGILDFTHRRQFTSKSLKSLLIQCGYTIRKVRGVPAPYPKAIGNNFISRSLLGINRLLISLCRSLFSYQLFVEASALPTVDDLLKETHEASGKLSQELIQAGEEAASR